MEATFKIRAAAFDNEFIETVKGFLALIKDGYVIVSIGEDGPLYSEKLLRSKEQLEKGKNLVSFTMQELEAFATSKNDV